MNSIKFICVCKESPVYNLEYVNRLINGFNKFNTKNIQAHCITSISPQADFMIPMKYQWPGWWSKLELCRPDISGDILYMDLDTIIRGNIDRVIDICANTNQPIMLKDFLRKKQLASGVMWLPELYRRQLWDKWIKRPRRWMRLYKRIGDQGFIRETIGESCLRWQNILPQNYITSLKVHCRQQTPQETSIICYHGRPRPHEINWSEKFIPEWWKK